MSKYLLVSDAVRVIADAKLVVFKISNPDGFVSAKEDAPKLTTHVELAV